MLILLRPRGWQINTDTLPHIFSSIFKDMRGQEEAVWRTKSRLKQDDEPVSRTEHGRRGTQARRLTLIYTTRVFPTGSGWDRDPVAEGQDFSLRVFPTGSGWDRDPVAEGQDFKTSDLQSATTGLQDGTWKTRNAGPRNNKNPEEERL